MTRTLARPWAVPGTPGLEHRIGGLEKRGRDRQHQLRRGEPRADDAPAARRRWTGSPTDIPPLEVDDPDGDAELLVLGWGSTLGTIRAAVRRARAGPDDRVAAAHLRHLNPFPANTGEVVRRYPKVLIPEMNLGQLAMLIRGRFLVDARRSQGPGPAASWPRSSSRRSRRLDE